MKVAFDVDKKGRSTATTPSLSPLRSDGERQRRRRRRERRRRLGDDRHLHRPPDPRRLRPEHGDERGQPRLCPARLRRARRSVRRGDQRLRRDRQRRAHAARHLARADDVVHDGEQRQRRADGSCQGGKKHDDGDLDFTMALGFGASQADAVQTAERALEAHVRQGAPRLGRGLGRLRPEAATTRRRSCRGSSRSVPTTCATRTS